MIKVLSIDDSALIRRFIKDTFEDIEDIEIAASASNPIFGQNKLKKYDIDVIILDVEMPKMDGITFLKKIMKENPLPVVMFSSVTKKNCDTTIKALDLGAVDFVTKPGGDYSDKLDEIKHELINKVRIASRANLKNTKTKKIKKDYKFKKAVNKKISDIRFKKNRSGKIHKPIILIGASTGGTVAVSEVIEALPDNLPGICIVQHIPGKFSTSFAETLNNKSKLKVQEAVDNSSVKKNNVYIAPGGLHMILKNRGSSGFKLKIKDGPKVNWQKPAVDVLFKSAANLNAKNILAIIMTGMGEDGAKGMKLLKDVGVYTVAQDEDTSVVFGMPKKAIEYNAVKKVLPIESIPRIIVKFARKFM